MGRVRGSASLCGSTVPDTLVEAFGMEVDTPVASASTMESENIATPSPPFLNRHPNGDGPLVASGGATNSSGIVISTDDLRETMVSVLLLFSNAVSQQVVSHHELRAKVIENTFCSKSRQQYQKCLLEISLMALVETGHLVRHGFGSWAVYTSKADLWSGSAASGMATGNAGGPDRRVLDKLLKVSRTMIAAKLPVAGCRRQRSPLSPSAGCQPTKRRKGPSVALL